MFITWNCISFLYTTLSKQEEKLTVVLLPHTKIQALQCVMNKWVMKDPHFQLQMWRQYQITRIAHWIRSLGEPQTPPFVPLSWFCFNQSQRGEKQSWSAPFAAVFESPTETFSSPTTAIKKNIKGIKTLQKIWLWMIWEDKRATLLHTQEDYLRHRSEAANVF